MVRPNKSKEVSVALSSESMQVGEDNIVLKLRRLAISGLKRMYIPEKRIFVFRLGRENGLVIPAGISRRYTAIVLLGLAEESESTVSDILSGQSAHDVCDALNRDISIVTNLGDVALTLWAARLHDYSRVKKVRERLITLRPADDPYPLVEIAWALDALCSDVDFPDSTLKKRIAQRLMDSFNRKYSVFPHLLGDSGKGVRSIVSCFADMVYPIQALAHYHALTGDQQALDIAEQCALKICHLQGEDGQWWWHYDRRTGEVIEGYPVYSVHQDSMAPMALLAVQNAGGSDFTMEIARGLEWLRYSPEINTSLIDDDEGVIWRKVARREPGKISRYAQAIACRARPTLRVPYMDSLLPPVAVDYESRPYHMGWILYSWPESVAEQWGADEEER